MKLKIVLSILVLLLIYLLFWPTKVTPDSWNPPPAPKLESSFAKNEKLKAIEILYEGQCKECEDIAVDTNGAIYGGTVDGEILKFANGERIVLAKTEGRPLGLHFDAQQNLIVCDAQKGLLSIDPSGNIKVLETTYGNQPFLFTDDVDITKEGIIYFTDASYKYNNEQYKLDFIEHGANGRFFSYQPRTDNTTLLLDNLYFANGVALSANEDFVLVNETSAHRVKRYWLKGNKAGTTDIFLDNLPFYPDGVSRGDNGIFWIAMQSPRNGLLDGLSSQPYLRKMIAKVPKFMMPKPKNYSFVLGVDENGKVIYNLQDPDAKFAQITSIEQVGNTLYLGSLSENGIGKYELE